MGEVPEPKTGFLMLVGIDAVVTPDWTRTSTIPDPWWTVAVACESSITTLLAGTPRSGPQDGPRPPEKFCPRTVEVVLEAVRVVVPPAPGSAA